MYSSILALAEVEKKVLDHPVAEVPCTDEA